VQHVVGCLLAYLFHRREIQSHVSEPFWYISISYSEAAPSRARADFTWDRGRLFDQHMAALLYEVRQCVEGGCVACSGARALLCCSVSGRGMRLA
jgi:hypothetical protein